MKAMLQPLGLYTLEESINGAELESYGAQLDVCSDSLEETTQEMNLATAQGLGLERYLNLLKYKPVAESIQELRAALAALLRIRAGCFTPDAINDNLAGCSVGAVVRETGEKYVVEVTFPHLSLTEASLEQMKKVIEEIVPCHLQINYFYWVTEWSYFSTNELTWGMYPIKQTPGWTSCGWQTTSKKKGAIAKNRNGSNFASPRQSSVSLLTE